MRVEQDGEYLSHVSEEVLIDAFIPDNVGLEFLELELLSVFVQDGLRSPCLDPHHHGHGVELHVLVRLHEVLAVLRDHDWVLALHVGVTLQALLYFVKLFKLLLLLQVFGFDVEVEVARKQGALDLVELAQLFK